MRLRLLTPDPAARPALALRIVVTALLVTWLVARVDVLAALRLVGVAAVVPLALAVLCVVVTHGLNCLRWRACLLEEGRRIPLRVFLFSYWTALFAGLALPTEYGGDVLRVKDVWDRVDSGSAAVASVLWSRLSGLGATLFVFALVGLGRLERLSELSLVWLWLLGVVLGAALAAVVFVRWVPARVSRLVESLPGPERWRAGATRLLGRIQALATHRAYARRIMMLALAAQLSMIATNYLYARALGQPVALADMAIVVPIVTLSSLLPVSLGGLGVKEGAFVVCLTAIGLPAEGALAVALLNRLVLLALALLGGLLFPFRRRLLAGAVREDASGGA